MIRALRLGIPILVIALAVAMLSVSPALAAKGAKSNPPALVPASLAVSPNPVVAGGAAYAVTGSWFIANQIVYFMDTCLGASNTLVGSGGTFLVTLTSGSPGACQFDAYQYSGRKLVLMATVTYSAM